MIAQLLQPPGHIVVSLMFANIVNEQGSDGTTIVGGGDGSVTLLTGGIPDLSFDCFGVDLDRACGELDTTGPTSALFCFLNCHRDIIAYIVDLESRLNSLRVNRLKRLDFPTPESPIRTTDERVNI